ncbi:MAG: hypothetical protein JWM16_5878, partial [Verrucomicrobiales bacterium]|nr:hypothetical protein [Verrucomicrobiales bacterium]
AIDQPADITIDEDSGLRVVSVTGIHSGIASGSQTIVVSAVSSNPALIPTPTIQYVSPNAGGTLQFSPATNANGSAIITVTVDNGATSNNVVSRSFNVIVNAVNDAPKLDVISNLTLVANAGARTIPLTGIGTGASNESQVLTVTATSDNPGLMPNPTVNYSSPNQTGSIVLQPALNQNGIATITVTVRDNGGVANSGVDSISRTFTVRVGDDGMPRLRIAQAGNGLVLVAWPTNAVGLVLQSRDGLNSNGWSDVSTPRVIVGAEFIVTNAASAGSRFYRLGPPGLGAPQLRIFVPSPGFITVAWSTNYFGYELQSTPSFSPAVWTNQAGTISVVGSEFRLTLPATGNKYFRLSKGGPIDGGTPQLRIFVSSPGFVTVAWQTNYSGFQLQSTPSFSPAFWSTQPGTVTIVGTEYRVTLPAAGNKYFRLSKGGIATSDTPLLKISSQAPGSVMLSWSTDHVGFQLQSTASLVAPNWTDQSEAVSVKGNEFSVTMSATGNRFFRLINSTSLVPARPKLGQTSTAKTLQLAWPYGSSDSTTGQIPRKF